MLEEDKKELRNALGCYLTGVTVITATSSKKLIGVTANSFSSVSLDPPLVLWSIDKKSSRYRIMIDADNYAINVLSSNQAKVALDFVKNKDPFKKIKFHLSKNQVPIIENSLAVFECQKKDVFDGGDHSIILGKVLKYSFFEKKPLFFYKGDFGTL